MNLIPQQIDLLNKELQDIIEKRAILVDQKDNIVIHTSCDGETNGITTEEKEKIQEYTNRVRIINNLLATAIIASPTSDSTIEIGSHFSAQIAFDEDDIDVLEGTLVEELVTIEPVGEFFTIKSYLGKAIIGKSLGDNFSWELPNGKTVSGKITEVEYNKEPTKTLR